MRGLICEFIPYFFLKLVPRAGLEPARHCWHGILSPRPRIPPFRQVLSVKIQVCFYCDVLVSGSLDLKKCICLTYAFAYNAMFDPIQWKVLKVV